MGELEIKGDTAYLTRLKRHLAIEHPKTKGRMKVERRDKKMKKGRVTYKKEKGGDYNVCVGGVPKKLVHGVVKAKMEANRFRKMQGKAEIKKKVKKLLRN